MGKMKEKKKIISSLPPSAKVRWSQSCCCMLEFGFNKKIENLIGKLLLQYTPQSCPPIHKPSHSSIFSSFLFLLTIAFKSGEAKIFFKENRSIAFWGYENFFINIFFKMEAFHIRKEKDMKPMSLHFFSVENVIHNVSFLIHETKKRVEEIFISYFGWAKKFIVSY